MHSNKNSHKSSVFWHIHPVPTLLKAFLWLNILQGLRDIYAHFKGSYPAFTRKIPYDYANKRDREVNLELPVYQFIEQNLSVTGGSHRLQIIRKEKCTVKYMSKMRIINFSYQICIFFQNIKYFIQSQPCIYKFKCKCIKYVLNNFHLQNNCLNDILILFFFFTRNRML